jgi:hypothetical protein
MMWHGPVGRCIFCVCKHFGWPERPTYIYMSIHVYGDPNVFYMCFLLMFMMISILYAVTGCMICLCVCGLM